MSIIAEWLINPEIWIIIGIIFVILEVFVAGMVALPIGLAAFGMSILVYVDGKYWLADQRLVSSWENILIVFSALTVICVIALRYLLKKEDRPDINKY